MSEIVAKKDNTWVQVAIFSAIVLIFWLMPPFQPITTCGMRLIGVFVAAVYGWTVTNRAWPSLLCFSLLILTGVADLNSLLAVSWGADIMLFVIMMFVALDYLRESGFATFLSAWMLTRKSLTGHPYRVMGMLFALTLFLSTFCGLAILLIMWSLVYQICDLCGYKPLSKQASAMVFGCGVMVALSLSAVPFLHNSLVILAAFTQLTGMEVELLRYLSFSIPVDIFCIFGYLLLCKYIFRIDFSAMENMTMDFIPKEDLEFTKSVKMAFWFVIVLVALLVLPEVMPKDFVLTQALNTLGYSGRAFILFAIWSVIKVGDDYAMHISKLAKSGLEWGMVFMLVDIFVFINFLGAKNVGLSAFFSYVLAPAFSGLSPALFMLFGLIVTVILSNFLANMVVAVIMMTATFPIAIQLGIDITQLGYLYAVGATIAFCLPPASPPSSLMFSNKEWLNAKMIYKLSIPTIIMMTIVTYVWNLIVFMFEEMSNRALILFHLQ